MIKKLRKKFIIISTVVIFAVTSAIVTAINVFLRVRVDYETDRIINLISQNRGVMPTPPHLNADQMEGISEEMPFRSRYFTITVKENKIVSINISKVSTIDESEAENYLAYVNKSGKTKGYYKDYKWTEIVGDGEKMYIFLECGSEIRLLKKILSSSVIFGFGVSTLIFILIWIFSGVAVRPVAESYTKQKQFITDANHEIKTPLAIIGATNEVLEMEYGSNEWSDTIATQIAKLNSLIDKLIFMSRMDEENAVVSMEKVNLSNIVEEVSAPFNNMAIAQEKILTANIEPDIIYFGDTSLLGQLVSVLLENAFKYSPKGSEIKLNLTRSFKDVKLTVENTAENIEGKNLDKLFDRFYRLDGSHNSESGGSGIGLSFAKSIVSVHKGKISARSENKNRIIFTVTL